ncbi:hypothetical protein BDA96_01G013100 [Sorghum bicolor]|uniref:Uncharacterized protein n=1 Tax=Sorghum bicolor TaxID=4558 RepID=A0A921RUG4_SORBI|nr:hypothetical protein BDA96_01G013100 [Sorghum bicolor]
MCKVSGFWCWAKTYIGPLESGPARNVAEPYSHRISYVGWVCNVWSFSFSPDKD